MAQETDIGEVLELVRPIARSPAKAATAPPSKAAPLPMQRKPFDHTAKRHPNWPTILAILATIALWAGIVWIGGFVGSVVGL